MKEQNHHLVCLVNVFLIIIYNLNYVHIFLDDPLSTK